MNHDVIIIGGGPAGSTAAMSLAQAGRRVLVLEKEKFPRFHIGESLLPYNVLLFQKLGVWPKIEAGGFMPKRGAQFLSGSDPRHIRINFGDGAFTECPAAIQVERSRFDQILLEHARECGAEVREQCLVLSHEITADGVSVKYRNADGVVGEERAAFLIDASGLSNFTANRAGERKIYPTHKKVAIFGHFTGVEMPTGECYGDILIVRRRNSWSWLIPLSAEKTSVGLVVDAADLKSSGMAPADLFSSAMEDTPALKQRMQHATRVGDMHVLSDFSYKNDALVAPRLVRAGDASGFIDPIFSSGVFLATTSGHWGALAVHEALQQGRTMTPAMRRFERDTRRRISVYWQFIEGFYTDPFTQLFFEPQDFMKLPSAINCVLAGRADLPFSAKWRLWLFFFLVWVQKRWPLTPRVEIRS
jgi:flavin-dependent dehydrogenase